MAPLGAVAYIPDTFARDPALRGWQPEQRRSEIEEPWSTYHNGQRLGQVRLAPTRRACRPPRFPPAALLAAATTWPAHAGVLALRVHRPQQADGPATAIPGPRGPPSAQARLPRPRPDAPRPHNSPAFPAPPGTPARNAKTTTGRPAAQRPTRPAGTFRRQSAPAPGSRHPPSTGPASSRRCVRPRLARARGSTASVTIPVHADLRRRA